MTSIHNRHITRQWIAEYHIPVLLIAVLALFPFGLSHQLPLAILAVIGLVRAFRADPAAWTQAETRLFLAVFGLLFVPLAVSTIHAVDLSEALSTGGRYLAFLFIGLAVLLTRPSRPWMPALMWAILVILSIWVLDGLIQFLSGTNLLGYPPDRGQLTGLFYPNRSIGIFLAHLAPFYLEALRRSSPGRPWIWLLAIPYVAVILLAGSRASWLTALLALGAYGLYLAIIFRVSWKRMAMLATAVLAAGVVVAVVSPDLQVRLERTAGLFTLDYEHWNRATTGRLTIWSAAIEVFRDHWITGTGARGFAPAAMEAGYLTRRFSHVHLFLLEVPVATGVAGIAGYVAALGALLVWYLRRGARRGVLFAPWLAIMLALFPLNAHWHFYGTYFTSLLWLIFLLAMIASREAAPPGLLTGKPKHAVTDK